MKRETEKIFLGLIRKRLFGEELPEVPADLDCEELYSELDQQRLLQLIGDYYCLLPLSEELSEKWMKHYFADLRKSENLAILQKEITELFDRKGISYIILKGDAAGRYYPDYLYHISGDIDFLLSPEMFSAAEKELLQKGFLKIEENSNHSAYEKDGKEIELHREYVFDGEKELKKVFDKQLAEGLQNRETAYRENVKFYVLPQKENGLVLLQHIRRHLKGGIGFRQMIDWTMYCRVVLDDAYWNKEFRQTAELFHMEKLAKTATALGILKFGLSPENHRFAEDIPAELVEQLYQYIQKSGNFGFKKDFYSRKTVSTVAHLKKRPLRYLQEGGLKTWEAAKKHKVLRPFAWLHQIVRYTKIGISKKPNTEDLKGNLRLFEELEI